MAADDDWGDIDSVPKKRSGTKLLFCGLGCLLPVIFVIVIGSYGVSAVRRAQDRDLQASELRERLPYDELPEGWRLLFGIQPGGLDWLFDEEAFLFSDRASVEEIEGGRVILLIWSDDDVGPMFDLTHESIEPYVVAPPAPEATAEATAEESPAETSPEGGAAAEGAPEGADRPPAQSEPAQSEPSGEPGRELGPEPEIVETIEVDGLELPVVVARGRIGEDDAWFTFGSGGQQPGEDRPAVVVRISPADAERSIVLIGQSGTMEPMDLDTIRAFLEPFELPGEE